jgi:hypothetical protein
VESAHGIPTLPQPVVICSSAAAASGIVNANALAQFWTTTVVPTRTRS